MADQAHINSILAAFAQRTGGSQLAGAYQAPANTAQAGIAQTYPAPMQSPTAAAAGVGNFQLPQPANSGTLDISTIKPASSGTVSIADAIAKARGIAAEKGINFDARNAPRPAATRDAELRPTGRPFQSSRSRSRSPAPPPRRENYRDNYNPYRDERRSDRRGASARDSYRGQSPSPGPRDRRGLGSSTYSPPPSSGKPFGGGGGVGGGGRADRSLGERGSPPDDNVETIQIDSSLVGLIIGRQGENLRRVETDTGARVQFVTGPDSLGPTRSCKITGSRQARNDAKSEIHRIIDENGRPGAGQSDRRSGGGSGGGGGGGIGGGGIGGGGGGSSSSNGGGSINGSGMHQPALREGEDSMQIMVPDRTVGLIIGRGGETIRDLQERSKCHVNIVGESKSMHGLRPVNLIGTPQAAARAKELIIEIVESDTKSLSGQGSLAREPAPGGAYGGAGGYGAGAHGGYGGGDRLNDSIRVPSDSVGMIIGKGGETIREMQNITGCKINVAPQTGPHELEREIGLIGSRESIERAKQAIEDKVEVVKQGNRGGHAAGDAYGDRPPQRPMSYPSSADLQASQMQMQMQMQMQGGAMGPSSGGGVGGIAGAGAGAGAGGGGAVAGNSSTMAAATGAATDAADPYAAYGGYNNYVAMWYAAMAQQQQLQQQQPQFQGQQGHGEQPKAPGTT